jgi:hypothetical protein
VWLGWEECRQILGAAEGVIDPVSIAIPHACLPICLVEEYDVDGKHGGGHPTGLKVFEQSCAEGKKTFGEEF